MRCPGPCACVAAGSGFHYARDLKDPLSVLDKCLDVLGGEVTLPVLTKVLEAGCRDTDGQARIREYMQGLKDAFRGAFEGKEDKGRKWAKEEIIGKGGLLIRNRYVLEFWMKEIEKMKGDVDEKIKAMKLR